MKFRLSLGFFLAENMRYFTHPDRNQKESMNTLHSVSLGLQTALAKSAGLNASCQQAHPLKRVTLPPSIFNEGSPKRLQGFQQDGKGFTQPHSNQGGAEQPSGNDTSRAFMSVVPLQFYKSDCGRNNKHEHLSHP